jgi:hypothetical protein
VPHHRLGVADVERPNFLLQLAIGRAHPLVMAKVLQP